MMVSSFTSAGAYDIGFTKAPDVDIPERRKPEMTEKNQIRSDDEAGITLVYDGMDIPLNPFVQRFIQATVRGMVHSLDGVPESPGVIEITIREK